ncbi:hypothetical protein K439DRAFT_813076 [Ramaria rubella]|nr:hypothetical protein K439DRAFT_813076 [Ramaria rubella]
MSFISTRSAYLARVVPSPSCAAVSLYIRGQRSTFDACNVQPYTSRNAVITYHSAYHFSYTSPQPDIILGGPTAITHYAPLIHCERSRGRAPSPSLSHPIHFSPTSHPHSSCQPRQTASCSVLNNTPRFCRRILYQYRPSAGIFPYSRVTSVSEEWYSMESKPSMSRSSCSFAEGYTST